MSSQVSGRGHGWNISNHRSPYTPPPVAYLPCPRCGAEAQPATAAAAAAAAGPAEGAADRVGLAGQPGIIHGLLVPSYVANQWGINWLGSVLFLSAFICLFFPLFPLPSSSLLGLLLVLLVLLLVVLDGCCRLRYLTD